MLSERLKYLRKKNGITQKQLAKSVGISERFCQELEYGTTTPNIDKASALADYFDVSIDYLVGRSDDPRRY